MPLSAQCSAAYARQWLPLIAAPTFSLAKSARISLVNCWIPIVSALLIWIMGVNPVYILLMAGIGGYLYGLLVKPTE